MVLCHTVMGEGAPLLLLHGLFGAGKNLGVLARALSRRAQVISFDMRNHGHSRRGVAMDYATMAADVRESCTALGVNSALVAGHSMGGKTAMMLALSEPGFVTKLAVMDIAPVRYAHEYDGYVQAMREMKLEPGMSRAAADAMLAPAVQEPAMRAFLLNNLSLGAAPAWRLGLQEIAQAMPDLVGWNEPMGAAPYQGPALFLRGADSNYVTREAVPEIMRLFPNADVRSIAGAGHWLHAEKPAEVVTALEDFLFL